MKTWHKLLTVVIASLLTGGCATSQVVADYVATAQCKLPEPVRIKERELYFKANGGERLLVGMCKGDEGFEEFVQTYLINQKVKLERVESVVRDVKSGDYGSAILKLAEDGIELKSIKVTEDGCFELDHGTFCPKK